MASPKVVGSSPIQFFGTCPGIGGYGNIYTLTQSSIHPVTFAYEDVYDFSGGTSDGSNPYGNLVYSTDNGAPSMVQHQQVAPVMGEPFSIILFRAPIMATSLTLQETQGRVRFGATCQGIVVSLAPAMKAAPIVTEKSGKRIHFNSSGRHSGRFANRSLFFATEANLLPWSRPARQTPEGRPIAVINRSTPSGRH